jgi:hypothetical protein
MAEGFAGLNPDPNLLQHRANDRLRDAAQTILALVTTIQVPFEYHEK